ncbi:MAG: hypothetical protein Q8R26_03810 [bacterium]|nr:hypothetical protein [bacterium]
MFSVPAIFKDRHITSFFVVASIFLILSFSVAYVQFADTTNLLVIHFDTYKGIDFFGSTSDVFDVLMTAVIVFIINTALIHVFYFRERFLAYILAVVTAFFTVLIFIGINVIITVN